MGWPEMAGKHKNSATQVCDCRRLRRPDPGSSGFRVFGVFGVFFGISGFFFLVFRVFRFFLGFSLGFWGWILTWHPKLGLYRAYGCFRVKILG